MYFVHKNLIIKYIILQNSPKTDVNIYFGGLFHITGGIYINLKNGGVL